jgi:3-methylfumaryl-CoA hydratase
MFAGAQINIFGGARVGMSMTRSSRTLSMTEKVGRSGPMLFTSIENRYEANGASAIVEVQDIVYRRKTKSSEVRQVATDTMGESQFIWGLDVRVDAILLFRFSALTYNAHRIHYDLSFAKNDEGYPGLVVHGPLQALFLAELCRRHAQSERIEDFEFRALHPLFDGGTMRLRAKREGKKVLLSAFDQFGQNTMKASATLENLV